MAPVEMQDDCKDGCQIDEESGESAIAQCFAAEVAGWIRIEYEPNGIGDCTCGKEVDGECLQSGRQIGLSALRCMMWQCQQ